MEDTNVEGLWPPKMVFVLFWLAAAGIGYLMTRAVASEQLDGWMFGLRYGAYGGGSLAMIGTYEYLSSKQREGSTLKARKWKAVGFLASAILVAIVWVVLSWVNSFLGNAAFTAIFSAYALAGVWIFCQKQVAKAKETKTR